MDRTPRNGAYVSDGMVWRDDRVMVVRAYDGRDRLRLPISYVGHVGTITKVGLRGNLRLRMEHNDEDCAVSDPVTCLRRWPPPGNDNGIEA